MIPVVTTTPATIEQTPPLVYATAAAIEQAARILPRGAVLEVEVARLATCGRLSRWRHDGERSHGTAERWANGDGWVARVTRSTGRLDPTRSAWLVLEVRPR